MQSTTTSASPIVARLVERVGTPLSWHPATKSIFCVGAIAPLTLWYLLVFWYLQSHPSIAPYVDQAALEGASKSTGAVLVAWLVVLVVALFMRGRPSSCRMLMRVTFLVYVVQVCLAAHLFGLHTSLAAGLAVVAGPIVGWVLFDRRDVTWGTAFLLLALACMTAAEQAGLLRYAPVLAAAPFQDGRLAASWLASIGGVTFVGLIALLAVCYFIIERWHDQEAKIVAASEQLTRANELISRYVASQLAQQIKQGNYEALDRHARRKVTLFFSDIQGFSAVADTVEPEDLSAVLNHYLSEMTAIGKEHGATIDKFVGDAIMIFFGAPLATTDRDHALRAVRMAIAMQERMAILRESWAAEGFEHPFHIRVGINTGHASIGNFGSSERLDYTAIGRQVNLAARLQSHCAPDRVLLSHSTWVLVNDAIPCAPKGEIQVKGFQRPVSVYEVLGPGEAA